MARVLVTGAAGFIGSHLVNRLLQDGHHVIGIDGMLPNYDIKIKERNLALNRSQERFHFIRENLLSLDLAKLMKGAKWVFHLAGQPGVRKSWGQAFRLYTENNIETTQALLEAAAHTGIEKFVFASTSSVYGDVPVPMVEAGPVRPVSPYGVTKLAAEHLCHLYLVQYGVPAVCLRYFTVFGPRQRPDMAFDLFIRRALNHTPITLHGNGLIQRDFTYVDDVVQGNILAASAGKPGEVYNIGGGNQVTLLRVLEAMGTVMGSKPEFQVDVAVPKGDMQATLADISKAREQLGYQPTVSLVEGLRKQVDWISAGQNAEPNGEHQGNSLTDGGQVG